MQGAGAISETILVCKPFFRTLLSSRSLVARCKASVFRHRMLINYRLPVISLSGN